MAVLGRSEEKKTLLMRLAFANGLFKPREQENSDRKQWQCTLLLPKGSDKAWLDKLVLDAATDAWKSDVQKLVAAGLLKNPVLDGDGPQGVNKKTAERYPGFEGQWFIRVGSGEAYRPKLVNQRVLPITSEEELYSGCYVYAVIHAYAWDNPQGGKGVSFGVSMIQKVRDGEKLGSGAAGGNPEDHFEKIEDAGEAPAAAKAGAGAGGLFG